MRSAGHPILTAEADAFRLQFEQLSADAESLVRPLSNDDFHNRPAPNVWSVAECLEHLNVTARMYLPALDEGIGVAIRGGLYGEGPFNRQLGGTARRGKHGAPATVPNEDDESP